MVGNCFGEIIRQIKTRMQQTYVISKITKDTYKQIVFSTHLGRLVLLIEWRACACNPYIPQQVFNLGTVCEVSPSYFVFVFCWFRFSACRLFFSPEHKSRQVHARSSVAIVHLRPVQVSRMQVSLFSPPAPLASTCYADVRERPCALRPVPRSAC